MKPQGLAIMIADKASSPMGNKRKRDAEEADEEDEGDDEEDYSEGKVKAAADVRLAIKSGDDEELAERQKARKSRAVESGFKQAPAPKRAGDTATHARRPSARKRARAR